MVFVRGLWLEGLGLGTLGLSFEEGGGGGLFGETPLGEEFKLDDDERLFSGLLFPKLLVTLFCSPCPSFDNLPV